MRRGRPSPRLRIDFGRLIEVDDSERTTRAEEGGEAAMLSAVSRRLIMVAAYYTFTLPARSSSPSPLKAVSSPAPRAAHTCLSMAADV